MRTKHFSISIPEPCSENWEEMTPCERGRFCGSCQKTVIDFTTWSDAELIDFWSRKENWGTCGRFYNHHVEEKTPFSFTAPPTKPYRTLAMAASVAALTIMSAAAASAQGYSTAGPPPFPILRCDSSEASAPIKDSTVKSITLTKEEIEKRSVRSLADQLSIDGAVLKKGRDDLGLLSDGSRVHCGAPGDSTLIIIDGLQQKPPKRNLFQRISAWFKKTF